jgi:hypothetical protein
MMMTYRFNPIEEVVEPFGTITRRFTDGSIVANVNGYVVSIEYAGHYLLLTHSVVGMNQEKEVFATVDELKNYLSKLGA